MKSNMKTKVIFRQWVDGDVIALFPEILSTLNPYEFLSYMHVGQHATADSGIISRTKPAKPTAYRPLAQELRSIGYRLQIIKKNRQSFLKTRQAELDKMIGQLAA